MLEQDLRELFVQQTTGDEPPIRASIARAASDGRTQRRKHRTEAAVVAAVLALAVVALSNVIPARFASSAGPSVSGAAPDHFSPLRPYATFGWLPARSGRAFFETSSSVEIASAGAATLSVYSANACKLETGILTCPETYQSAWLGQPVGRIGGHPAYSLSNITAEPDEPYLNTAVPNALLPTEQPLAWQYAPGGWAILSIENLRGSAGPEDLRIARSARFGPTVAPAIRFPYQLTRMPPGWTVSQVEATWDMHVVIAKAYNVTAEPTANPWFSVPNDVTAVISPGTGDTCRPATGSAMINGHRVTICAPGPSGSTSVLCARGYGISVCITENADAVITPADLFEHHMRLLGPDPADWTTEPIAASGR